MGIAGALALCWLGGYPVSGTRSAESGNFDLQPGHLRLLGVRRTSSDEVEIDLRLNLSHVPHQRYSKATVGIAASLEGAGKVTTIERGAPFPSEISLLFRCCCAEGLAPASLHVELTVCLSDYREKWNWQGFETRASESVGRLKTDLPVEIPP